MGQESRPGRRPTRRRSSISMPTGARSSWPPRSMRTRPRPAGRPSATARRSISRSRRTTRGPAADPRPRQGHGRGRRGGRPDRSPPGDAADPGAVFGSRGLEPDHSAPATDALLTDLRSDVGMEWVPNDAWLTKVVVDWMPVTCGTTSRSTRRAAVSPRPSTPGSRPSGPTRARGRRSCCCSSGGGSGDRRAGAARTLERRRWSPAADGHA